MPPSGTGSGSGPAVGISVDLDLGGTLQRLADLQEALGTLGRLQGSPWNRSDYHLGVAQGSFAVDNPQPYQTGGGASGGGPPPTPVASGSTGGFSGNAGTIHIAQVQSLTIQTAAQVTVYGSGAGGGQTPTGHVPADQTATPPQPSAQQQVTGGQVAGPSPAGAPTQTVTPVAGINIPVPGAFDPNARIMPGFWPAGSPPGSGPGAGGVPPPPPGSAPGTPGQPGQPPQNPNPFQQAPAPPQASTGMQLTDAMMGRLQGLAGAFGAQQMVSWMGHLENIRQKFEYGGGDVRESQRSYEAITSIPLLGPLISLFTGQTYKKGQQVEGVHAVEQYMGLAGPMELAQRQAADMTQSPTFLAAEQQMALSGLHMPGSLRSRFNEPATFRASRNTPGAFASPPDPTTGATHYEVANPRYLDPAVRDSVLSSFQRVRGSEAVMGTYGFDDLDESRMSASEQMMMVAAAEGDYSAAQVLAGQVSGAAGDDVRRFGGAMLRNQFQGRLSGLAASREGAISQRYRMQGNFGAAAERMAPKGFQIGDDGSMPEFAGGGQVGYLENQKRLLDEQISRLDNSGFLTQIGGEMNPGLQNALREHITQLEAERERLQGEILNVRMGAAETRYQGEASMGGSLSSLGSSQAERGFLTGRGSYRRETAALVGLRGAQWTADASTQYVADLKGLGVTGDVLARAEASQGSALLGLEQGRVSAAQTPVDLGLQSSLSSSQYRTQVLQRAYGYIPGANLDQLGVLGQETQQVQQQQAQQRSAGQLNPAAEYEYQQRLQQLGGQLEEGRIQAAQVPVSIGLQSRLSASQYQAQVLQSVPGAYGNIRGAYRDQLGVLEEEAQQVQGQREQQRSAGQLNPAAEFEYQQRLQQLGVQQAQAFEQLSYGWENRVMSRAINSPGSFNLEGRGFSMMNTVTAGAWNPHFGARADQLPFFLRMANLARLPVSGLPGVQGLGPGIPGLPEPAGATPGPGGDPFGAYGPAGSYVGTPLGTPPGTTAGTGTASGGGVGAGVGDSGSSYGLPFGTPDGVYPPLASPGPVPVAPYSGPGAFSEPGLPLLNPSATGGAGGAGGASPYGSPGMSPGGVSPAFGGRSGASPSRLAPPARRPHPLHDDGGHLLRDPSGRPIMSDGSSPDAAASPPTMEEMIRRRDAPYFHPTAPEIHLPHSVTIDGRRAAPPRSFNTAPYSADLPGMEIIAPGDYHSPGSRSHPASSGPGTAIQGYSPKFGGGQIASHSDNGVITVRIELVVKDGNNSLLASARKDVTAGSVAAALNSGGLEDLLNQLGAVTATQNN